MGRSSNDDRSDSMNPNNHAYDDSRDNRSNQLNPNNDAYWSSRSESQTSATDDDDFDVPRVAANLHSSALPMQSSTEHMGTDTQLDQFEVPIQLFLSVIFVDRHFSCRKVRVKIMCDEHEGGYLERCRKEIFDAWERSSLWYMRIEYPNNLATDNLVLLEETRSLDSISSPVQKSVQASIKTIGDFLAGNLDIHYLHFQTSTCDYRSFIQSLLEDKT